MPWWVWALVVWAVLAVTVAVVVGQVIRSADRRESRGDRSVRDDDDDQAPPRGRRAS
ncbi:hypothetical protein [Geodermatophilus arenarius]|uniref:Uncharacterized protein n=1 Tax=Geodermatophilus arenarius TaxID=1137990 RepID=A0ABV9LJC3_9ACTN